MAARIESDFPALAVLRQGRRARQRIRKNGAIELMPVADDETYTVKYVNGHPINTRYGLPTVMAFGVLADVATGMPRLISRADA